MMTESRGDGRGRGGPRGRGLAGRPSREPPLAGGPWRGGGPAGRRAWVALAVALVLAGCSWGPSTAPSRTERPPGSAATPTYPPTAAAAAEESAPERQGPPSSRRRLVLRRIIRGAIAPKSVVASGTGLFLAQNMMYRHTITVYDRRGKLVKTIPDAVDLSDFGFEQYGGTHRGAPVEAAFSPNGRYAYVSNYSMYGPGFGAEGSDSCSPASGYDESFVYRIDTRDLEIDRVIRVGTVPKFVAVTPDNRLVLVTNWCSYTLSVISVRKGREIRSIELGPYPRGIAVSPDSETAYVAVMGTTSVAAVDLDDFHVHWIAGVGGGPRHLVIGPDGRHLYVTLNRDGVVAKIHARSGRVVARVATGSAPRSMAIADDGKSLYVVNYGSNSVSKVRVRDMEVLQTVPTNPHPIGIAYDGESNQVWVACYSGSIMVFRDRPRR